MGETVMYFTLIVAMGVTCVLGGVVFLYAACFSWAFRDDERRQAREEEIVAGIGRRNELALDNTVKPSRLRAHVPPATSASALLS
jgi:hypothetical protein